MFESKINRGKANGYAPLGSTGKVPLDYLPPIQSTLNTGSFATTGSNTFTGVQTLSGTYGTSGASLTIGQIGLIAEGSFDINASASGSGFLSVISDAASIFGAVSASNFGPYSKNATFVTSVSGVPINDGGGPVAFVAIQNENPSDTKQWIYNYDGKTYLPGDVHVGFAEFGYSSSGSLTVSGSVFVSGSVYAKNLATTGSNIFKGNQSISGSVNISSSLVVASSVVSNGSINALNSDLIINGGYLIVSGASYFSGSLFVNGNIYATNLTGSFATTGSNIFKGNQSISGSIEFLGNGNINTNIVGVPTGISDWAGGGGWNQGYYSNITASGGTGTGLRVNVAAGGGGYINIGTISINTPGSGYTVGDVVTINNENNISGQFTISSVANYSNNWKFGTDGNLIAPKNIILSGSFAQQVNYAPFGSGSYTTPSTDVTKLDITKDIHLIDITAYESTSHFYLPNGLYDGQVVRFALKGDGTSTPNTVYVWVDALRSYNGVLQSDTNWSPFFDNGGDGYDNPRSLATAVYIDGAWNIDNNFWNMY